MFEFFRLMVNTYFLCIFIILFIVFSMIACSYIVIFLDEVAKTIKKDVKKFLGVI